ncbi:hypothetical protein COC42_09335 [Sphingomonas spermidinifaciens]|uniref:UrcA family protein n=1 Tax=Sphingomonas spermidinifaciens TaxID=1141889 RepID=A0A2A4B9U7_9SPHN|nr:hypothetical protein [Sphingomonas spermidinifaciens]PCD04446.1 hypothetical protein COC42_09335 [Sphingomonas spermidinifaciens]
MRKLLSIGALLLAVSGTMPAAAQDRGFEDEVLRRLDRMERRIDALERELDRERGYDRPRGGYSQRPAAREETVAAVSLLCGADCGMAAANYCRRAGFQRGVAVTIEKRMNLDHVTRARCFD